VRVLLLHNRYQLKGGEDAVVQAEKALLEAKGHQVTLLETTNDTIASVWEKANAAVRAIYSPASKQQVSAKIAHFRPDVVHVHNFFPLLSPSVYDACRDTGVAVVQTLHNYRLGCPNAMLFRNGKVCEDCLGKKMPWPGIIHGCYRGSRTQSAVTAAMLAVHWLRGTWQERVDAYIALTAFQKEKMVQAGLPREKIHVKPNYVLAPESLGDCKTLGDYALFVGRLSQEKSVATLIEAYQYNDLLIPLKIVGDGPLRAALQTEVQAAGLEDVIEFLGRRDRSAVLSLMCRAKFLVFPSAWYEGFPVTIAEAFACGLPVLTSRLGSMAEIVEDCVTGLYFEAGNSVDLADKMQWANEHPEEMIWMGKNARRAYEARYTPEDNYQQLVTIYQQVIDVRSSVREIATN
jgi:glycosyltransferase involved in cell wall biosynthesis